MSWLTRLFGREPEAAKSLDFEYEGGGPIADVLAGYPHWLPFDSYGQIYRKQPAVRTVVDFIAQNIAQLNPKIYDRVGANDRREWPEHPVALLLANPNPETTRYRFLFATAADQCIYDRAYWRKIRQGGITAALVRIPPSRLQVLVDYDTLKTTYKFKGETISRTDLVILPGYHPDGGEEGVSPLETLRRVLAEEWAASIYREWYFRNGARHSGIIERPNDAPEWDKTARDRMLADFNEKTRGGTGSGTIPMLEDGMKFVKGSFSPADSQYLEARELTQIEVARVYSPALARLLDQDGGSVEALHRQLYQDVLAPRLRMLQDEIDLQLLGLDEFNQGGNPYSEFNLADKLKGSFEEQADTLVRSVGVPYMSINEGRARLNLPRLEGGEYDEPIQPLNVLYGGQPSVVNPTADPGNPEGMVSRETLLAKFYERQAKSVLAALGAGPLNGGWQEARWNRELARLVGDEEAERINTETRTAVDNAYTMGGRDAVAAWFEQLGATV